MALPSKLKHFATFVDGENYVGEIPEVTLPKLTRKLEEYISGGMSGPIEQDYHVEKLEAELKAAGWFVGLLKQWGNPAHDGAQLRFVGSVQADDITGAKPLEVVMRGRLKEWDPGGAKAGDKTEQTYKYGLSYYRLVFDGQVLLEFDLVNMVEIVGGVDRLATHRAILGIGN